MGRRSLLVAAALAALLALIVGLPATLVPHTVENGKAIDAAFLKAAAFVDSYQNKTGKLPSEEVFNGWKAAQQIPKSWLDTIHLVSPDSVPESALKRFGVPKRNSYALFLWRGEWPEYYASWSRSSTVDSAIELYVSSIGLGLIFAFVSMVLRALARKQRTPGSIAEESF